MLVLHLSENECTRLVKEILESSKFDQTLPLCKQAQHPYLWNLICQIENTFGLRWREDRKAFIRPV